VTSTDTQNTGQSPLHSDLGTTTIQDAVVTAIITMAAEEVEGVATSHGGVKLPGDTSPTVGEFVDNITGGASRTRGLSVDVGELQTAADITINVEYGRSIPKVTQAVRKRIIERVQKVKSPGSCKRVAAPSTLTLLLRFPLVSAPSSAYQAEGLCPVLVATAPTASSQAPR
jgi:uncharacterized alkaline shock family protein YloU